MTTCCRHITDEDLQGIVDGAFDSNTHERLMHDVREDAQLQKRLIDLYEQKFLLQEWWRLQPIV